MEQFFYIFFVFFSLRLVDLKQLEGIKVHLDRKQIFDDIRLVVISRYSHNMRQFTKCIVFLLIDIYNVVTCGVHLYPY